MKKILSLILVAMMSITMLVGCGTTENGGNGDKSYTYIAGEEAFTLDSASNTELDAAALFELLTPPLVYNIDGEVKNIVAEDWKVSDDGLVYTFYMKDDYVWENGDPLTAYDYEYSAHRWADPATGAISGGKETDYILNAYEIYEAQSIDDVDQLGIRAVDDYTLEIELNRPCPFFMELIGETMWLYPLHKEFVESCGDEYASSPEKFMACGPYRLSEWTHDAEITLEKNENHFEADKYDAQTITRAMVDDPGTAINMYENGEVDTVFYVGAEYISEYQDEIIRDSSANAWNLMYNFESPNNEKIMRNENFRKALSYALDREAIVNAVAGDDGTIAWNRPISTKIKGVEKKFYEEYEVEAAPVTGDEESAKKYFDAALEELGYNSAEELPIIEFATLEGTDYKAYAEAMCDTWAQVLGITNIQVKQFPFNTLMGLQDELSYDMMYWSCRSATDPYLALLEVSDDFSPYNGWDDPEYLDRLRATNKISDNQKRLDVLAELEQEIIDEGALMTLWHRGNNVLNADYVEGMDGNLDWICLENLKLNK